MLKKKVVQNKISYKKLSGRISLSPPAVKLGGSKDLPFFKSGTGKTGSLQGFNSV